MSYFARNGVSAPQYHNYIPESVSLQNIGLSSYTRNSFKNFGYRTDKNNNKILDKDVEEYFGGAPPSTLLGDSSELFILYFDAENNRYIEKSSNKTGVNHIFYSASGNDGDGGNIATDLQDFQTKWDNIQKGFGKESGLSDNDIYAVNDVYSNIKNSLSGCITFTTPNYSILNCDETSLIRIYFTAAGKTSTDRKVAFKDVPTFVVPAVDNVFQRQSHYDTSSVGPGQSVAAREGGVDNPNNTVAAKPQYRVDNVTGKVEFGTFQVLAVLLADLDASPTPIMPENIDITKFSEYNFTNVKTSFAVPLTAHNGNPKLIGPNSYDCEGNKKQKILVHNITPRSYKRGELVLCSMINGIWIPLGYDQPKVTPTQVDISWSNIQKFIVDAKSFFRNIDDTVDLLPNTYSEIGRLRFYNSLNTYGKRDELISQGNNFHKLLYLNYFGYSPEEIYTYENGTTNIPSSYSIEDILQLLESKAGVPSLRGYKAVYDTDVLGPGWGGVNDKTVLAFTNASQTPRDDEDRDYFYAHKTTHSFGVYFTDGYTKSSVLKMRRRAGELMGYNGFVHHMMFTTYGKFDPYEQSNFPVNIDNIKKVTNNPLANDDLNLHHMPAQIAIHSRENRIPIASVLEDTFNSFNIGTGRGDYIDNPAFSGGFLLGGKENTGLYNLVPRSSNKLQFSPLGITSLLWGFKKLVPDAQYNYLDYNLHKLEINSYKEYDGTVISSPDQSTPIFANIIKRINYGVPGKYVVDPGGLPRFECFIPFGQEFLQKGDANFRKPVSVSSSSNELIKANRSQADLIPDGNPGGIGLFPNQCSCVVGIVTMKGTFKASTGIKFNVQNHWGHGALPEVIGSTEATTSYIPNSLGGSTFTIGPNPTRTNIKTFYGSTAGLSSINSFGTMKLIAKVYDHHKRTLYDGRYFTPFFLNPNDDSVDFKDIEQDVGTVVSDQTKLTTVTNTIRRGMLLNDSGFIYIRKTLGIDYSSIQLEPSDDPDIPSGGVNYSVGNIIRFGGEKGAIIEVTAVDDVGSITKYAPKEDENGNLLYGDYRVNDDGSTAFSSPMPGTVELGDGTSLGTGARLTATRGRIFEKIQKDPPPVLHGEATLTASDDNGLGFNNTGWLWNSTQSSISITPNANNPSGLYDIYLFYVNDPGIYPDNNSYQIDGQLADPPFAQYVNLEITGL